MLDIWQSINKISKSNEVEQNKLWKSGKRDLKDMAVYLQCKDRTFEGIIPNLKHKASL